MNTTFNDISIAQFHNDGIIMVTVSASIAVCLPLNGYIMWLTLARTSGTLTSNFFYLNLVTAEMLFSLFSTSYIVYTQLKSLLFFEVFVFSNGLIFTGRPVLLCYICVESYVGVVHPVLFLRCKPLRYRLSCGCIAWMLTLIACIYIKFTYLKPVYLYGFFIQNLLIFFVMTSCCLSVLRALKRPGPGEKVTGKKKDNLMKRRALKIILQITAFQVCTFFLYVVAIPLQCCLGYRDFFTALNICTSLALATGFVQSLFYLHRDGKLVCCGDF